VYLAAVARLGTSPGRTVAIEDSRHGVAAARAAGLPVLGVSRIPGREGDLDAADLVVDAVDVEALQRLAGGGRGPDLPYDPAADD
jgi:beta-phosphoglucomutase-like phosphatase (HAD superfamily)